MIRSDWIPEPTANPTSYPTMEPTLPSYAPTLSPSDHPTFTAKTLYVRKSGCDWGYCTAPSKDYDDICEAPHSWNVAEGEIDYCCQCTSLILMDLESGEYSLGIRARDSSMSGMFQIDAICDNQDDNTTATTAAPGLCLYPYDSTSLKIYDMDSINHY